VEVIVLIGLPGSGKSTWASNYPCTGKKVVLASDDDLIEPTTGVYWWTRERVDQAHKNVMLQFIDHLQAEDVDLVILDNTNTRLEFVAPYLFVASAFEVKVRLIHIKHDVRDSLARNRHGVNSGRHADMERNLTYMLEHWPEDFQPIEVVEI